jgi:hypothetical protein
MDGPFNFTIDFRSIFDQAMKNEQTKYREVVVTAQEKLGAAFDEIKKTGSASFKIIGCRWTTVIMDSVKVMCERNGIVFAIEKMRRRENAFSIVDPTDPVTRCPILRVSLRLLCQACDAPKRKRGNPSAGSNDEDDDDDEDEDDDDDDGYAEPKKRKKAAANDDDDDYDDTEEDDSGGDLTRGAISRELDRPPTRNDDGLNQSRSVWLVKHRATLKRECFTCKTLDTVNWRFHPCSMMGHPWCDRMYCNACFHSGFGYGWARHKYPEIISKMPPDEAAVLLAHRSLEEVEASLALSKKKKEKKKTNESFADEGK